MVTETQGSYIDGGDEGMVIPVDENLYKFCSVNTYHKSKSSWIACNPTRVELSKLCEESLDLFLCCISVEISDVNLAIHSGKFVTSMISDYDFDIIDQLIDEELYGISHRPPKPELEVDRKKYQDRSNGVRDRSSRSRSNHREKRRRSHSSDEDRARRSDVARHDKPRREPGDQDRSQREDCSIMVMGLHPQVGDREVYEFFSKEAGKVRDVYVIRDQRTGKSKGVSYVEFYLSDSVLKALACNGRSIMGLPIRVQASGAEKNRAAQAQKAAQVQRQERPITLYIMGMNGPLSEITEDDLKKIFGPFGDIDYVNIGRCPYTGRNRGFAHLQFARALDARDAMSSLNGLDLGGYTLQVGYLARSLDNEQPEARRQLDPDSTSEYIRSNEERTRVMESLMYR